MAKYHREFLVPYLRDVYALHLAMHKLQERLAVLEQQKGASERVAQFKDKPPKPRYEAANGVFLLGFGIYMFVFSLVMLWFRLILLGCFCVMIGIMSAIVGGIRYNKVSRENSDKEARYNLRLMKYREFQLSGGKNTQDTAPILEEMHRCRAEIERAREVLQRLYTTNLIPELHRNLDAAGFLYVWFCTGSANDLDTAFHICTLMKTNATLDRIETDRKQNVLKQYLQLAEESPGPMAPSAIPKHPDVPNEERNTYLAMIESNNATAAYFASAQYLLGL